MKSFKNFVFKRPVQTTGFVILVTSFLIDPIFGKPLSIGLLQEAGILFGVALVLLGTWPELAGKVLNAILNLGVVLSKLAFAIGIVLLLINILGLFIPLRNQSMYSESVRYGGKDRLAQYTPRQLFAKIDREENETAKD